MCKVRLAARLRNETTPLFKWIAQHLRWEWKTFERTPLRRSRQTDCPLAEIIESAKTLPVSRRAKTITFTFCAVVVIATFFISRAPREPSYQGRSLSIWLAMYSGGWDYENDAPIKPEQAAVAIRAMGTKAPPIILKWMSYETHSEGIPPLIDRLPFIGAAYVGNIEKNQKQAYATSDFFKIMGKQAAPAIPKLTRMATNHRNLTVRYRAAEALADIGEEAIPGIAAFLKTPEDPERRHFAFRLLVDDRLKFYTNTSVLVRPLIDCTASHDADLAIYAMGILAMLPLDPKVVLPAMTNALRSSDKQIRREAFIHSWRLGYTDAARLALSDPDLDVRKTATNVLGGKWIAVQEEATQTTSPR